LCGGHGGTILLGKGEKTSDEGKQKQALEGGKKIMKCSCVWVSSKALMNIFLKLLVREEEKQQMKSRLGSK
jgi:hypothetical protein